MSDEQTVDQQVVVTSLDEIRKKQQEYSDGVVFKLPSGMVLKLRRPSLSRMIRDKIVPQSLVSAAVRIAVGKGTTSADDLSDNIKLMEFVLEKAIVEPEGMTLADIELLSEDDKAEAFMFVQRGLTGLNSFRQ